MAKHRGTSSYEAEDTCMSYEEDDTRIPGGKDQWPNTEVLPHLGVRTNGQTRRHVIIRQVWGYKVAVVSQPLPLSKACTCIFRGTKCEFSVY